MIGKYNTFDFSAGGCLDVTQASTSTQDLISPISVCNKANKFVAPRKIDYRDMLVVSSDQGQTCHCVGYACAGVAEFWHWRQKHYPKQFDGDAIYTEAKKIDKQPDIKGTWPRYGIRAAIDLGYISGEPILITVTGWDDIKFAMHRYGVIVAGFKINSNWNKIEKKTGIISTSKNPIPLGGHAVLLCGYDDIGVYIQNSWSDAWGISGFGILRWDAFMAEFMMAIAMEVKN